MRCLLCLALCTLLLSASSAHDVEDDFDDEAEVEVEAEDTVVVEKVTIDYPYHSLPKFVESFCDTSCLTIHIKQVTIDVPYLTPSDNVDFYFMDALDSSESLGVKWTR